MCKFNKKLDLHANKDKVETGNQIFKDWSSSHFLGQNGWLHSLVSLWLERWRDNQHDGSDSAGTRRCEGWSLESVLNQVYAAPLNCLLSMAPKVPKHHQTWSLVTRRNHQGPS